MEQGDVIPAEQFIRHALSIDPSNANTHYTLAILLLGTGRFDEGWLEHEHRFTKGLAPVFKRNYPVLIWSEQGIGDQIAYAHMFNDVLARAKHCVFACSKKLIPLFKQSFPNAQIMDLDDPALFDPNLVDVQSAAGSVGRWLRPDYASFDRPTAILCADPNRVSYWRQRLAAWNSKLKVGICWRSGDLTGDRSLYCSQLLDWGAVLSVPNVEFINLQYDDCSVELEETYQQTGVRVQVFPEVDLFDDLLETAALTRALDLVISAPTAASIIAGAVDVPVWRMSSGFNWQRRNADGNIFFRSMRTFSKSWDQGWDGVMEEIAKRLKMLANVD